MTAGVIDDLQLRSALAESARWGKRIGEVLVARDHCSASQMLQAMAAAPGVSASLLSMTTTIPPRVLRLLPPAFARDNQVLPLAGGGRTSTVEAAVADPAFYELLDEIRFRTGHEVRALVATPAELSLAIEHFYFGAPRQPAPTQRVDRPTIDIPNVTDPEGDLFLHGIDTGEFLGRGQPALSTPMVPSIAQMAPAADPKASRNTGQRPNIPNIAVTVRRTDSAELPLVSPPGPVPGEIKTIRAQTKTPAVPELHGNEVARLEMQVAELQGQLEKVFGILREAAIAHRTLLAELAERGYIDKNTHSKRVREQLQAAISEAEPR